ncbi:MAG: type II toxin-antitoxin system VapC family toxin [Polaromonas sp.]|nr:type II toxin-antitoxin system VapC family toxin [Polaromonas sp.]
MKYLLDTDTLIYVFKRAGNCLPRLENEHDSDIATSTINLFELEFGMAKSSNRTLMARYVSAISGRYAVLGLDLAASQQAGRVRAHLQASGSPIGPYDVLIAGIALTHNLTVVTRNVREFSRVPQLKVENWYD